MHALCTFRLAGRLFGIDVQNVQEVLRDVDVTPAPLACDLVRGLINLRGQIVAAVDLRRCLDLPPAESSPGASVHFIVRDAGEPLSFLVDEVGDVLTTEGLDFDSLSGTGDPTQMQRLTGVFHLPNELLRVVNVPAVVQSVLARRLENVAHGSPGGLALPTAPAAG